MGFLPILIGAALATLPVLEEAVTALAPIATAGPSLELCSVVTVPVPVRPPQHAHYRLRVAASSVWVDGARLTPNEEGDFDLLNLNPKRPSRVAIPGWVKEAVMIETPRVFVSRYEIEDRTARLWVRNSLENTVNIYVTVSSAAGGPQLETSDTIPPGYTKILPLTGRTGISGPPWRIMLEKQEEAMEGGYRFIKTVERRTGPTVKSYVKP